jgi:hypothetical protein
MADLREGYRVIQELLCAAAENQRFRLEDRTTWNALGRSDLIEKRPRLDFIPPFALPQPTEGRAAVYLLNRLSNNVNEPGLMGGGQSEGAGVFPQIFNWSFQACRVLGLFEIGERDPEHLGLRITELENYHSKLTQADVDPKEKFNLLLELGKGLAGASPRKTLFTIPVPHLNPARGKVPKSFHLDANHKMNVKPMMRALNDFLAGRDAETAMAGSDKAAYSRARWTLDTEQRVIACETAWLAGELGAVPFHLHPLPGQLHDALRQLNTALESNSRKISAMFRGVEVALSELLPQGVVDDLAQGDSSVVFFSDLPFEWTLVEGWPVCLTRPVSRIPIGFSNWNILSAALEHPLTLDRRHPEKVLVIDLIEKHDRIRSNSDSFIFASEANAQRYTYASPRDSQEFKTVLAKTEPDIVVLDSHGRYDRGRDQVSILIHGTWVLLDVLLEWSRVPPVWILSACHTSVTGAMRGSFVRHLLERGALCVIATLNRVDAFTASMFVGRLLTEIYNPVTSGDVTLMDAFFITQYTTALVYDPLLPLFRRAERDAALKEHLGAVMFEFFNWTKGRTLEIRKYREEVAWIMGEAMARHGLTTAYVGSLQAGNVRPETLLFTIFGAPGLIDIEGALSH